MPQTVVGIFHLLSEARIAETKLLASGFTNSMVDVSPANATGAVAGSGPESDGSVKRFFKGLFGSDAEADRYASVANSSEALVTVHASTADDARRASDILDAAGSIDIDDHTARTQTDGGSIKVIREDLQVGKRTVETGGARLRSRIVEREVSQEIRLKQERVIVKRTPVDRVASAADLAAFRDGKIEIVEHAEVPVVAKEVRVVEEVSLKKEQNERVETVRDTVRSTEVEVEKLGTEKKK